MSIFKEIKSQLKWLNIKIDNLNHDINVRVGELEQAKACLNSQLVVKTNVIEQLTEYRDRLRSENDRLRRDLHAFDGRLRHLLQSETVRLFDQMDGRGNYRRDIKRLDTYGVHYKVKEHETKPRSYPFEDDKDALMAPGGKMITFPGDNVKVKDLANGLDIVVARDYVEITEQNGVKTKLNLSKKHCGTCKHSNAVFVVEHCFDCDGASNWEPKQ